MHARSITETTAVAHRLCRTYLAPLVHSAVRRALRVAGLGDTGFIAASCPEPPEPSCGSAGAASVGVRGMCSAPSTCPPILP